MGRRPRGCRRGDVWHAAGERDLPGGKRGCGSRPRDGAVDQGGGGEGHGRAGHPFEGRRDGRGGPHGSRRRRRSRCTAESAWPRPHGGRVGRPPGPSGRPPRGLREHRQLQRGLPGRGGRAGPGGDHRHPHGHGAQRGRVRTPLRGSLFRRRSGHGQGRARLPAGGLRLRPRRDGPGVRGCEQAPDGARRAGRQRGWCRRRGVHRRW